MVRRLETWPRSCGSVERSCLTISVYIPTVSALPVNHTRAVAAAKHSGSRILRSFEASLTNSQAVDRNFDLVAPGGKITARGDHRSASRRCNRYYLSNARLN